MFVVSFIALATFATPFYQPSLEPNVAMALWGQSRRSYAAGFLMISAITTFGAARFGIIALERSLPAVVANSRRLRWLVLVGLVAAIAWFPVHRDAFQALVQWPATSLVVTAAVLTVDCATARWRTPQVRKVNWIGLAALLAGCATPLYLPNSMVGATSDVSWHPWLLPSYGVGFLICLFGRTMQKLARVQSTS